MWRWRDADNYRLPQRPDRRGGEHCHSDEYGRAGDELLLDDRVDAGRLPLPDQYVITVGIGLRVWPPVELGLTSSTGKRELAEREEAAVAATTVTVTQTTYTVTVTDVTTLPASTTTEDVFETTTTTMYVLTHLILLF